MRVLVLGGAGGMGRRAATEAAARAEVAQLTVADRNGAAAQSRAARLGPKAEGRAVDVAEPSLRDLLAAHDVVLNCVGPFYRFGVPVLRRVIDAGGPRLYADICDDWEPTLEMLALDSAARAAGITGIIGLGASPGVSNLLALRAARALDQVDTLVTGWSIEGDAIESEPPAERGDARAAGVSAAEVNEAPVSAAPVSAAPVSAAPVSAAPVSAAVVHWVQQLTGSIRVWRGGALTDVKPLERRDLPWPGGGTLPVWSVGHPEAVTLPRSIPGLQECVNGMVGPADAFAGLAQLAALVDAGQLTNERAAELIVADMARGREAKRPAAAAGPRRPGLFAWARGTKDGRPALATAQVLSMPAGGMAGATSVPLALALPLAAAGAFTGRHGIFTPEAIVEPGAFFDLLAPLCLGSFADGAALVSEAVAHV